MQSLHGIKIKINSLSPTSQGHTCTKWKYYYQCNFKGIDSQTRKAISPAIKWLILDIIILEKSKIHQYDEKLQQNQRKGKPAEKQKEHPNLSQLEANMKLTKKKGPKESARPKCQKESFSDFIAWVPVVNNRKKGEKDSGCPLLNPLVQPCFRRPQKLKGQISITYLEQT